MNFDYRNVPNRNSAEKCCLQSMTSTFISNTLDCTVVLITFVLVFQTAF